MEATRQKLNDFLSSLDTNFVIPIYQRNYDWTEAECKQLFNDIINAGETETAHFIGSIVFIKDNIYTTNETKKLSIIDGQQRLTTITLMYIILKNIAKEIGDESLENKIFERYLINKDLKEEDKIKLQSEGYNQEVLKQLIYGYEIGKEEYSNNLIRNYNYLRNIILKENYKTVYDGIKQLIYVDISLEKGRDNPQKIFESLNSTGLDLSQADLIRNYVLMDLEKDQQNELYNNYWGKIEKLAKDEKGITKVSDFIRDYLTLKNKKIPNKNKVYQEFKIKYDEKEFKNLKVLLSDLLDYANYYNKLINPENEKDKQIKKQLNYINNIEINVSYPFLMNVYKDYSKNIIDKDTFISVLELIQSYVWRRFIVGLPTNALNKVFMKLYEEVDKEKYLYSIQKSLMLKKGTQYFPKNKEIELALKDKDVYNIKNKNKEYFLERLENYNNKETVSIFNNEKITVEHIFPQNPDRKWKEKLNDNDYIEFKDVYIHTISNLTLSGNNGKLGNKYFTEKRDMNKNGEEQGYKFSRLWLNRYLKDLDKWDIEELNNRYEIIKERFFQIWKYPEIIIEESEYSSEVNIFDAEDPKGKDIDYMVLFDEKIDVINAKDFYKKVIQYFYSLDKTSFFNTEIPTIIDLKKDKDKCQAPLNLNNEYYYEAGISNNEKFKRIKKILTILKCEDELLIKYKE
jgi:uncharacterized protein with ParB-like and HNH nuclease domain